MTITVIQPPRRQRDQQFTFPPSIISTCLKQSEVDSCSRFTHENDIDLTRFNHLYDIAKRVRFGQFAVDFTELGASVEDSRAINQLYRLGLNFHQLGLYLQAKSSGCQ